jgi:hypothetical protein
MSLLALLVVFSATCRPAWYQPAALDYEKLDEDKSAFVQVADQVGRSLAARKPVELAIDEDQLNRWIVARRELPEDFQWDVTGVQHPRIRVESDGVRVGCLVERYGVRAVASCLVVVRSDGETLTLEVAETRLGSLPLPGGWIARSLSALTHDRSGQVRKVDSSGIVLLNDWYWPSSKRRFRISRIEPEDGRLRVELTPIP